MVETRRSYPLINNRSHRSYYQRYKSQFLSEGKIAVSYVRLPLDRAQRDAPVSRGELESYFERNRQRYQTAHGEASAFELTKGRVEADLKRERCIGELLFFRIF